MNNDTLSSYIFKYDNICTLQINIYCCLCIISQMITVVIIAILQYTIFINIKIVGNMLYKGRAHLRHGQYIGGAIWKGHCFGGWHCETICILWGAFWRSLYFVMLASIPFDLSRLAEV